MAAPDGASTGTDGASMDTPSVGMCGADVPAGQECNGLANLGAAVTPICKTGPCRVRFSDLNGPIPNLELTQRSAVYDGQVSGRGGWECGGVTSTATLHLHLHIDEAGAVNDQWRASKISGTYNVSISPQLGCRAGGATYAVRGVLHTGP